MQSSRVVSVALVGFVLLVSGVATAQEAERSRWGVGGRLTPSWTTEKKLFSPLFEFDEVDFRGSELEIGIVRGAMGRGDAGVSFVRKRISDRSRLVDSYGPVCLDATCQEGGRETYTFRSAAAQGIEAYKFIPFKTFQRRAQVGMTVAGGIGWYRGSVVLDRVDVDVPFLGFGRAPEITRTTSQETLDIRDFVRDRGTVEFLPLARVEITGAVLAYDNLKIKLGGGFNFPGTARFTVSALYLFGNPRP